MQSPIEFALNYVQNNIPMELLSRAFRIEDTYDTYSMTSIEERIRFHVIEKTIRPLLDTVGGQMELIPLWNLGFRIVNNNYVYHIPLEATMGRLITAAHAIEHGPADMGLSGSVTTALLDGASPIESTGTARISIAGPNCVAIREFVPAVNAFLRCTLSNDESFNNISASYHLDFAELCLIAARSYVYNKISIAMGDGANTGGEPSSYLRSTLDEYRDAQTMLLEQVRTKWYRIMIQQDQKVKNRLVRLLMGSPL